MGTRRRWMQPFSDREDELLSRGFSHAFPKSLQDMHIARTLMERKAGATGLCLWCQGGQMVTRYFLHPNGEKRVYAVCSACDFWIIAGHYDPNSVPPTDEQIQRWEAEFEAEVERLEKEMV